MRPLLLMAVFVLLSACGERGLPAADTGPQEKQDARTPPASLAPEVGPPKCILCVRSNPLLVVDKDGGEIGELSLCNDGPSPVPLALRLSDFHVIRPKVEEYPLSTIRTLTGTEGKPIAAGTLLAPATCIAVKIQVARIWQGGLAAARLTNANNDLVEIKAARYDVPFNLKADGPTPEKLELSFTRGQVGHVELRNEDPEGYRFHWRLELGNATYESADYVGPKGRISLLVRLADDNYSFLESGFLRSGARSGRLILDYEPDTSFRSLPRPQRTYLAAARLNYLGDPGQRISNYIFVLLVLLMGIGIALLLNFALPTQKARVDVKQRLADLDGRLAGLGDAVDSRLLSLLRVEKRRLGKELHHLWPVFPQTAIDLPKLGARVDLIAQRIDLTVQAGELLHSIRVDGDRLSVQEVTEITEHCTAVFGVVRKPFPSEDEAKAAQESLQIAAKILKEADGAPAQERFASLCQRQKDVDAAIAKYRPAISMWAHSEWKKGTLPFDGAKLAGDMLGGFQRTSKEALPH